MRVAERIPRYGKEETAMKKYRKTDAGRIRRKAAVCMLLMMALLMSCVSPAWAMTIRDTRIEDATGETQELLACIAADKLKLEEKIGMPIPIHRNGQVRGRGLSDEPSGIEPRYFGLVGYAVVPNNGSMSMGEDSLILPWKVPTYIRFDSKWFITKSIPHKTAVLVLAQVLVETSEGRYTGRLQVVRLDCNEICFIDVENFIAAPYWFYAPRRAIRYGSSIAVYRQHSGHDPEDPNGRAYPLAEETRILIPGADSWDLTVPNGSNVIPGIAFEKTEYGMIPTVLFFQEEDLTLIY